MERIVLASPGAWEAASARYRLGPLQRAGPWPISAVSAGAFPSDEQIRALLDLGGGDAALVLQRVLPSRSELERLRRAYRHVAFDFDDAIYAVPPALGKSWRAEAPKRLARLLLRGSSSASARKRPLQRTLEHVDVCVAGNSILARFARRHARRVVEIPTTIEPVPEPPATRPQAPVLVWQGLPENLQYLALVREPLQAIARDVDFRLRIISSEAWNDAPVAAEFVPWSPEASREGLLTSSVGLAPLVDDPWTQGKCAFRSIQYGAHALPTVASPVGITDQVVLDRKTGFLARTSDDWEAALRTLLADDALAGEMGAAALEHVRSHYSDAVAVERWRGVLESLSA